MRRGWACGLLLAGLCAAAAGRAQDEKKAGPPAPGAPVPSALRAYVVVDDRYPVKGKEARPGDRDPRDRTKMMHDFVIERGLNPTLAILAHPQTKEVPAADSPVAGLIKQVDPLVAKHKANTFGAFAVFLVLEKEYPQDESRDASGQYVREVKAQQVRALADAMKKPDAPFGVPLALAAESQQAAAWGATTNELVVVLYDRMRVVKAWVVPAGQQLTAEQLKDILATTEKTASGK